jgi:hypothetical protein
MSKVSVTKIKPYPIQAQFSGGATPFAGEILKLVRAGFIAHIGKQMVTVGDHLKTQFEIPVSHFQIVAAVRVRKTSDRMIMETHEIQHLIEFTFEHPTDDQQRHIHSFLNAIGQDDI